MVRFEKLENRLADKNLVRFESLENRLNHEHAKKIPEYLWIDPDSSWNRSEES